MSQVEFNIRLYLHEFIEEKTTTTTTTENMQLSCLHLNDNDVMPSHTRTLFLYISSFNLEAEDLKKKKIIFWLSTFSYSV